MTKDMPDGDPLPPCGFYRTAAPVAGVEAGRLVYFHDHGRPGPGLYLPARWEGNVARFHRRGHTLRDPADAARLVRLPAQGLYRVVEAFHCCPQRHRHFEADLLVQLGYDGAARALVFVPELVRGQLALPTRGTRVDEAMLDRLAPLRVSAGGGGVHVPAEPGDEDPDLLLH
jgi:hypothetical protein